MSSDFNQDEVNKLINSIWNKSILRSKFEEYLSLLDITKNQAIENLEISTRTLDGILDGTLKQVDFLSLLKVAQFLEMSYDEIATLYIEAIEIKHKNDLEQSKRRSFIINNFDLPVLKSIGVIDSIRDFNHIEQRLNKILNLSTIIDFDMDDVGAALSSSARVPKNLNSRKYFISQAKSVFKLIGNPNPYSKDALVAYFPNIRWHSLDIENGLLSVIQSLYKLGITVIFRPRMPKVEMRGATFAVNEKPCIILTDYRGYYPTLWFALIHELFHVLFDWEEILQKKYHLSEEGSDLFAVKHKEGEANDFAREYMFSNENMEAVSDRISERLFIKEFALDNNVHPSIIYALYAYGNTDETNNFFILFKDFFPSFKSLLRKLGGDFEHASNVQVISNFYKTMVFNEKGD